MGVSPSPGSTPATPARTEAALRLLAEVGLPSEDNQSIRAVLSDAKRTLAALDAGRTQLLLAAIVESSDDAIISKNLDGIILSWNAGAERLFGYRAAEIIGRPITLIVPLEYIAEEDRIIATLRLGGRCDHLETVRVAKDGRRIDVSITIAPLKDADGRVFGASKIARDIGDRKRAEAAQRDIAQFPGQCPHPVIRIDGAGMVLYANPASAALGEGHWCEAGQPAPRALAEAAASAMAAGSIGEVELLAEGRVFSFLCAPVPGTGYANLYSRDVTDQKLADKALRDSEIEFRTLAESVPQIVWTTRPDGWNIYFNQRWVDYTGMTMEESHGHGWNTPFHPDDRLRAWEAWQGAVRHNVPYSLECRLRRADGVYRWWLVRGAPMSGADGTILKWFGTCTDIDDLKQAQDRNARQAAELGTLYATAPVGLCFLETDLRYARVNHAMAAIHGLSVEEHVGRRPRDLWTADVAGQIELLLRGVLETGRPVLDRELRGATTARPLEHRDWLVSYYPVQAADGTIRGVHGTIQEITARKRTEAALVATRIEAEHAMAAKDQFIAALSHELRTPLTPVLTTLHLMEAGGGLSEDQMESVGMIRRNVEVEVRLIDDLLDLTRLNRNKLSLHRVEVDMHDLLHRVLVICDGDVRSKRLQIVLDLAATARHAWGDAARLQQILWNLVKNSVKFTPAGGTLTLRTANPDPRRLTVRIEDTGVGIDPSQLPLIFNAFEQGPHAQRFGGLGLGLAIAQQIAELHGGTLKAASDGVGRGATFTLELEVCAEPGAIDSPRSASWHETPGPRRRVLFVEDHVDTGRVMARLLRSFGYECRLADCVATALRWADAEAFDVVISDIGLPDGSGLDLMRQLQAKRSFKGIALSGYGMEEDVRRSLDAGFAVHLTKPVDLTLLEQALHGLCDAAEIR